MPAPTGCGHWLRSPSSRNCSRLHPRNGRILIDLIIFKTARPRQTHRTLRGGFCMPVARPRAGPACAPSATPANSGQWHYVTALRKSWKQHCCLRAPARAQFLNVIESVFSGTARAIIHNSDYKSVDETKRAIFRLQQSHWQGLLSQLSCLGAGRFAAQNHVINVGTRTNLRLIQPCARFSY
jgi:hypothetical protein